MKINPLLGLCLSTSLLFAGTATMADNGKDKPKNARAMQVQLDKRTGKKLSAPDDSSASVEAAATTAIAEDSGVMAVRAESPRFSADGSRAARLGTENLKYLVLSVDENGNKTLSHQRPEHLDLQSSKQATEEQ